jgi:hypothetical protein
MRLDTRRIRAGLAMGGLAVFAVGCDADFTADLATDPPADPQIAAVEVNVRGLDFRKADGGSATLEFSAGELVDLLDLQDGEPLRLFTDEELPAGRYSGVRLLFDDDEDLNAVTTVDGEFPLQLVQGDFATVDFLVEDEERSRESITLLLDLRQSLAFDDAGDEYTLTPRLRAVATGDAARVEGAVGIVCPIGTSLATGGAVYLFPGRNVQPDDLDGVGAEPLATTRVVASGSTAFRYALRFLPAGDYTLAFTCRGDQDLLGSSEDLDFRNVRDVELDDGDVLQRDLN